MPKEEIGFSIFVLFMQFVIDENSTFLSNILYYFRIFRKKESLMQ